MATTIYNNNSKVKEIEKKCHLPGILPRREFESLLKAAAMEGSRLGWPSPAGSSGRV